VDSWTNIPDAYFVSSVHFVASLYHMSSAARSEFLCRLNSKRVLLDSIMRDCIATEEIEEGNSVLQVESDSKTFCLGFEEEPISLPESLGELNLHNVTLVNDGAACTTFVFTLVPKSQFESQTRVKISSSSIASTQSGLKSQNFIKNDNKVAIAELTGNGIGITTLTEIASGVDVCFFPPTSFNSQLEFDYFDIVTFSRDNETEENTFTMMGMRREKDDTTRICFPYQGDDILFIVAVMNDWEDVTYRDTLSDGEFGLLCVGAVVYGILLVLITVFFSWQAKVKTERKNHTTLWVLGILGGFVVCKDQRQFFIHLTVISF